MHVTKADLIAHARDCLARSPETSGRELQAELEAYYLQSSNSLSELLPLLAQAALPILNFPVAGAVASPGDWFKGLPLIIKGVGKILTTKTIDGQSVAEVIQGVVIIVGKNPNDGGKAKPK